MPVEETKTFTAFLPIGGGAFEKKNGSIQEVLNRLQAENITATKLISYLDDGINAEVSFCKRR